MKNYNLADLEIIKLFCKKYGIHPSRERGQNFLADQKILDKIVEAADLQKDDVVLEIGPGFGALTMELVKKVKQVIAVEADRQLVKALRETMANYKNNYKNIEIIEEDILKFSISNFQFSNKIQNPKSKIQNYGYKIVANLPYQITSAVFRKFLENEPRPKSMTVMVQKEVAERICAAPGKMSLLSVSVQFFGQPEIVATIPPAAFWPEPEVDSAILKISKIRHETETNIKRIELKRFFQVVKMGFSSRRKQLHNNLSGGLRRSDKEVQKILIDLDFNLKIRAQELEVDDWLKLAGRFTS
jgi:16S rRNA (adenine1518-N6/adenine1519-N6)-dimethyltransferase